MEDQAVCCYRHPERETGISCTRCDRPICPECMVNASVGFHCPECSGGTHTTGGGGATGGSARRMPGGGQLRALRGGSLAADPRLITKILLAINVLVWITVLSNEQMINDWALVGQWPPADSGLRPDQGVAEGEWYRLVSAMFLHEEPFHIAFNMLSLWWLGAPLEAALGRVRFLALYLLSGLGGSALSYLLADASQASLGASGAIFGLLGATAVLMRRLNYDMRPVVVLLALNLVFTFAWSDIAWQAHIGGLIIGTAVAYGIVHAPRERRDLVQVGTCVAVFLVIVGTVLLRTAQLTG
ncbi:rhomboid family intramembrane serine protease [Streptomyces zagrosensis]|uniref:Membrane associated rhomboid family serine protease n=1 Tax=Streptomyces zagrosensis TaxID=1042984 RepID=A0A7W9Q636_9ACTN|nr:rhomboid family intramembrane serine protease [Streptomyces zagrosensis]MBB5934074.1 membrane associated rhomboid family serine protease [Streptomyces zagrosensis]